MNLKPATTLLLMLSLTSVFLVAVVADVSVGVKQGDWIEYNVAFTGNPPVEHDVVWARMEVINVTAKKVNAMFVSRLTNETTLNVMEDVDLETGRLIDMFIIPSGLKAGDMFYDQTVGNVTIDRVEVRTYAGAARTVVHAEAIDTQWYWDKTTGVAVEARTASTMYTLDTIAASTGLWSPQIFGLDLAVFYSLAILAAVGLIIVVSVLLISRKRKTEQI